MPFVRIDLTKAREPEAVQEGEYDLRIHKAEDTKTKKGEPMTVATIIIEGEPKAAPMMHYMVHPNGGQYDHLRALDMKRFFKLFGVQFDEGGFDTSDLAGKTARCLLQQEQGDDGILRNRLRMPRVRE
jgi:hypothetical protein